MEIKIFTRSGGIRHTTDDSRKESTRSQQLMGDNLVSIVFDHDAEIQFKSGDYITWQGERFTLLDDYYPSRKNDAVYHYELKFQGAEGLLKAIPFFHYITTEEKSGKEPEFSYVGDLQLFADFVVQMLRIATGDETWAAEVDKNEGSKTITFSATNFYDALASIADTFKTEWWLTGKTLHFGRCETGDLQTFRAGESLMSVEIPANREAIPNRIYAYGGTRNITPDYTSQGVAYNTRLHLPEGIEYVDVTGGAENIVSQIVYFDNDEVGNVYPRYTGTISKVEVEGTSAFTIYYFMDKDLGFDPEKQLIEGTTMMVHFESGMLQGRDFEVAWHSGSKRFEIINTQEGDIQIPFGHTIPAVGDQYVLWNMEMPKIYIANAEQELLETAQKYVDDLNAKTPDVTCRAAESFFTAHGKSVGLGSRVKIEDTRLKGGYVQSRVTRYSYPLYCPQQVEFTLSENVSAGRLSRIEDKIEDLTAETESSIQYARSISRRAYRDATELAGALDSLQKELILVSSPDSQFATTCVFKTNKHNDPNLFAVSAGTLQHTVHLGATDGKWTIEGAEHTFTTDGIQYVYFKCSKTSTEGYVIVSPTRLALEEMPGVYLFLGGIVSSIFENARIVNIVSGFTQIAGGNITTERIQDPTRSLIIDLSANPPCIIARGGARMIGTFDFESASGLDNIEGIDDIKNDIVSAQSTAAAALLKAQEAKDYIDTTLPEEIEEINRRLDGVVENWFYPYSPTLGNEPASSWETPEMKGQHVGDTFTNTAPAKFDPADITFWEPGSAENGVGKTYQQNKIVNSSRIRLVELLSTADSVGKTITCTAPYLIACHWYDLDRKYVTGSEWGTSATIQNYPYMTIFLRKSDQSDITTEECKLAKMTAPNNLMSCDAGRSWRWVKEQTAYKWTPIADSDAVKALQEAARAQDTADNKRRVFVAQPKPPYDAGDIWAQGADGDIMRCIHSRPAGDFEGVDWEKASRYTDDTVAQEAMGRLAVMADNGELSKEEKPAVRQQWKQIQLEYAKYQEDATAHGVSIAALKAAFDILSAYLDSIALSSNSDTTISPDTFNQKFADYYAEVSRFSNLVAQKKAEEAVGNLQIGARNLIAKQFIREWNDNTAGRTDIVLTGSDADGNYLSVDYRAAQEIISAGDATRADVFRGKIKFGANTQYNFKVRWKLLYEMSATTRGMYFVFIYTDGTIDFVPIYGNNTSLVETTYLSKEGKTLDRISASYSNWNADGKTNRTLIYDIQLTEGNKAPTGYLTAEEDVQYAIDQAQEAIDAMNDDEIFDIPEKQSIRTQWESISGVANTTSFGTAGSYAKNKALGTQMGVSVDALQTTFGSLRMYLDSLALYSNVNTSGFDRKTMAARFTAYYDAEIALTNAISAKLVDDVQIGARNYIAKQFMQDWNNWKEGISDVVTAGSDTDGEYLMFDSNKASNAGVATPNVSNIMTWKDCFNGKIKYKPNTTYVFKARIKCPNKKSGSYFCAVYEDEYQIITRSPIPVSDEVYESIYTTKPGKSLLKIILYVGTWDPIYIYDIQLTEGNKAPAGYFEAEEDVQYAIDQAQAAVGDLNAYVDGAFKDGVIDASEAVAIEKYKNSVNETKTSMDKTYDALFANTYLTGAAKGNLTTAKTAFNTAVTNLLGSITSAIADGKTTAAEKADVDAKYALLATALATLNTRIEEANQAIQDAVKSSAVADVTKGTQFYIGRLIPTLGIRYAKLQIRTSIPEKTNTAYTLNITANVGAGATGVFNMSIMFYAYQTGIIRHKFIVNGEEYIKGVKLGVKNNLIDIQLKLAKEIMDAMFNVGLSADYGAVNSSYLSGWEIEGRTGAEADFIDDTYTTVIDVTRGETTGETKALAAQTTADLAKASAAASNALLSDIASDSKLTASEKQQTKLEWDRIKADYQQTLTQALAYKITTDRLTAVYNSLNSYIEPLLSNLNTTSDIVGTTFRKKFSDFYTVNTEMLNEVAAAIVALQDSLKTKLNDTEYIKQLFSKGTTEIAGGAVLTNAVALKGDDNESIVAMMNGSSVFKDTTHGIAMHVLGMSGTANWKQANTIMYEDGFITSKSMELQEGCKIGPFKIDGTGMARMYITDKIGDNSISAYWSSTHFSFFMSSPGTGANGQLNSGSFLLGQAGVTPDDQRNYVFSVSAPGENYAGIHINTYDREAMVIERGYIMGFRMLPKTIYATSGTGTYTLTDLDDVICYQGSSSMTITLPSAVRRGQRYEIIKDTTASMQFKGNGRNIKRFGVGNLPNQSITNFVGIIKFRYLQTQNVWAMTFETATGA